MIQGNHQSMKKSPLLRFLLGLSLAAGLSLCAWAQPSTSTAPTSDAPTPLVAPADQAAPKAGSPVFFELHESFLARAKSGPIDLLFLGDSITAGWKKAPHIWNHYYGAYQPANFGISGDRTQHVLWRIEQGELDGIAPKVVVLMIGTNNSGGNTAAEIATADRKIVAEIREKLPQTKVLLLAIFPRGPRADKTGVVTEEAIADATKRMAVIRDVNADLATLDDGDTIRYLDITRNFLGNDGTIPNIIMPDQLHPNAAGYQLWADAMQPLLKEMMGPAATH